MRGKIAAGIAIMAGLWIISGPSIAALSPPDTEIPMVRTSKVRDFVRITFEWPERTRFETRQNGTKLEIKFERPANPNFGAILSSTYPHVTKADLSADRRTMILTLDKPYRTRSFMSDNTAGIDLIDVEPAAGGEELMDTAVLAPSISPSTHAPAAEAKKPAKPAEKPAAKTEKPAPKPTPKVVEKPAEPKPTPTAKVEAVPAPKEVAAPAPTAKAEVETPPAAPTASAEAKSEPEKTAPAAEKAPAAAAAVPEAPKAEPTPVATATKEAPATVEPGVVKAADAAQQKAAAVTPAAETAAASPESAAAASAPASEAPKPTEEHVSTVTVEQTKPGEPIKVVPEATKNGFILHFPWDRRVASAVFEQGGYLWVVFNAPVPKYQWDSFRQFNQALVGAPEVMPGSNFNVVRFPIKVEPLYTKVTAKEKDFDWLVEFSAVPRRLALASRTVTSSAPPLKPNLTVEALEIAEKIVLIDPALGDQLEIIPFYKPGQGVAPARNFPEFNLLQTAQGMAVVRNDDTLRVALLRNGVRITSPNGITLSPILPQLEPDMTLAESDTLFPYARWKVADIKNYYKAVQDAQKAIADANGPNISRSELRLAQLYLSEGLNSEALGLLNLIKANDPAFYEQQRLAALRGAANFMMYRFQEASQDFAASELEDVTEVELWRHATNELLGVDDMPFNYVTNNAAFISKYPPAMRQRLAIIGADLAINREQYNVALKIFDILNRDKMLGPIQKYMDYMIASISAETGQAQGAIDIWEKQAHDDDRFIRSRAQFALTGLLLRDGKISRDEAIKRFDELRVAWRGDNFELNLLNLLGDMYAEDKNYLEALRTWRELVHNFPQFPDATTTAQRMADTFADLFNGDSGKDMKPLDALTLYYEFRELTPIGPAGDTMIQNLADRLVQVDLLDRAASLLNHQIRYRLEGEDRSRVGARLALINLLNHQPEKALDVLELTGYGNNPHDLRMTRNHLAAQAYNDLGEYDKALTVLGDDDGEDAQTLRTSIYWNKKDWPNVIANGEQLLGSRADITAQLTPKETDALMQLALAYVFENDLVQLQYLRDYFTPLVPAGPKKDMFSFVTRSDEPLDNRNFAQINQQVADVQTFLDKYKTDIEQKGLSSAIQ